jgi:hypothetical protein
LVKLQNIIYEYTKKISREELINLGKTSLRYCRKNWVNLKIDDPENWVVCHQKKEKRKVASLFVTS